MLAARSGILDDDVDVLIWLSSREPLPNEYIKELTAIVHREMSDAELIVEVRSIQESWEPEPVDE